MNYSEALIKEVLEKIKKRKILCVCELPKDFPLSPIEIWRETGIDLGGHYNSAGGFCCPHWGNTCGYHPEYE